MLILLKKKIKLHYIGTRIHYTVKNIGCRLKKLSKSL